MKPMHYLKSQASRAAFCLAAIFAAAAYSPGAESLLLTGATVHTVTGETLSPGQVLIRDGKIAAVGTTVPAGDKTLDLTGQHLYPGLVALNTVLGLTEISAVRATQDNEEVGDFIPAVEAWIASNPDSELVPVARVNGIASFEPAPQAGIVAGQSALVSVDGWTTEQRVIKKPIALHVFWPSLELNTAPKSKSADKSKWKSLEDQAKERAEKLRSLNEFFLDAKAYSDALAASTNGQTARPLLVPDWEAMLPYVRGQLPLVVHADEFRQIKSAVAWAATNHYRISIAGGRDAWKVASLLASNQVPVIYAQTFSQPVHDTDSYDTPFAAPGILQRAGVKVIFGMGSDSSSVANLRNLPYAAAQAVAFGLPADEALKAITLYPAQLAGAEDRLGSIAPGKDATLFASDGDILDIRSNVKHLWVAGKELPLDSRHTRLYDKYKNRPASR